MGENRLTERSTHGTTVPKSTASHWNEWAEYSVPFTWVASDKPLKDPPKRSQFTSECVGRRAAAGKPRGSGSVNTAQ